MLMLQARGGVMLIGPTGGGKTTVRLILQHALHLLPSLSEVHRRTNVFMEVLLHLVRHFRSFTENICHLMFLSVFKHAAKLVQI